MLDPKELCLQALLPCCWSPSQDDADNLPSFPPYEDLWEGGRFVYLGSGVYYKKILFISVQVFFSCILRPLLAPHMVISRMDQPTVNISQCRGACRILTLEVIKPRYCAGVRSGSLC